MRDTPEEHQVARLKIYSKPGCVQCTATYRALDSRNIPYDIVDLTDNPAALAYVTDELGYTQAPVVVANDLDHSSGFRPDRIDRLTRT